MSSQTILFAYLLHALLPFLTPDLSNQSSNFIGPPLWMPETEVFSLQTTDKSLKIRVFDVEGEPIPATIYRFHQGKETTYEAGRELDRGLYLVHVHSAYKNQDTLYKLIKIR